MASSDYIDSKVREIALDMMTDTNNYDGDTGLRWQSSAILALQEAAESYLGTHTHTTSTQHTSQPSLSYTLLSVHIHQTHCPSFI